MCLYQSIQMYTYLYFRYKHTYVYTSIYIHVYILYIYVNKARLWPLVGLLYLLPPLPSLLPSRVRVNPSCAWSPEEAASADLHAVLPPNQGQVHPRTTNSTFETSKKKSTYQPRVISLARLPRDNAQCTVVVGLLA